MPKYEIAIREAGSRRGNKWLAKAEFSELELQDIAEECEEMCSIGEKVLDMLIESKAVKRTYEVEVVIQVVADNGADAETCISNLLNAERDIIPEWDIYRVDRR